MGKGQGKGKASAADTLEANVNEFLDSSTWTILIMCITLYALFVADCKTMFFSKQTDQPLAIITLGVFLVFGFEQVMNIVLKREYGALEGNKRWNFYFWLDLIGTMSLMPDLIQVFGVEMGAPKSLILARVARAARIGARLTRLMKVFSSRGGNSRFASLVMADQIEEMNQSASGQIGEEVSDGISKRVVMLILVLLTVVPFFQYQYPDEGKQEALDFIARIGREKTNDLAAYSNGPLQLLANFEQTKLVYFKWESEDQPRVNWYDEDRMRKSELTDMLTSTAGDEKCEARFFVRQHAINDAAATILYMWFVIFVFASATMVFVNDVNELVVVPIERLTSVLKNLSKTMVTLQQTTDDQDEITFIGECIVNLIELLKVGLGDAGSKIVQQNIESAEDGINPMLPGHKMTGYYGFCDLRDFPGALKCLEEDTITYCNRVSKIVHDAVNEYQGNPNKNIGDSWLNVWTEAEEQIWASKEKGETFADYALQAFVEILDKTQKDEAIATLLDNDKFRDRYPDGYSCDMGFGLHYGWAIEGAVGSTAKIDATYLSPHVNMCARLEGASRQYGVHILVSEFFYDHLSEAKQRWMRKVDRVVLVGSNHPMVLYAYDEGLDEGLTSLKKKNRFAHEFDAAVDAYIAGDWVTAHKQLLMCQDVRPDDVPMQRILKYVEANCGEHYTAPPQWKGFHFLTEK